MSEATTDSFFPWSWSVSSQSEHPICPPSSSILGLYAAINAVCTILSILAGNSSIIRIITCGMFGNEDGNPWRYMWILPFGLQLGANACVAALTKSAPGYADQFQIWELMLFYTLRPRLSWIILGFIADVSTKRGKPWRSSFISNMIAELLLQVMALYTAGTVVHFATVRGYYVVHTNTYKALPQAAHLFYGGSLYYLVAGSAYILVFASSLFEYIDRAEARKAEGPNYLSRGHWVVVAPLITTWLASWLFLVRICPARWRQV